MWRLSNVLGSLCCLALLSASPASTTQSSSAKTDKRPPFAIVDAHSHSFSEAHAETFTIRVKRVKRLSFRLYTIANGKSRVAQAITYDWSKEDWPDGDWPAWADDFELEAMVLFESGTSFGVKGKQRIGLSTNPRLNVGLPWEGPGVTRVGDEAVIDGELVRRTPGTGGLGLSRLPSGAEGLLGVAQLEPRSESSWVVGVSSLDDLIKRSSSRPKLVYVAATVEWKDFD